MRTRRHRWRKIHDLYGLTGVARQGDRHRPGERLPGVGGRFATTGGVPYHPPTKGRVSPNNDELRRRPGTAASRGPYRRLEAVRRKDWPVTGAGRLCRCRRRANRAHLQGEAPGGREVAVVPAGDGRAGQRWRRRRPSSPRVISGAVRARNNSELLASGSTVAVFISMVCQKTIDSAAVGAHNCFITGRGLSLGVESAVVKC